MKNRLIYVLALRSARKNYWLVTTSAAYLAVFNVAPVSISIQKISLSIIYTHAYVFLKLIMWYSR